MHPLPPISIYLQPGHFSLDPALCNLLNIIRTKISHLIRQFRPKKWKFWLKISTHVILEVLIPGSDLDFWNTDPKLYFDWKSLTGKVKVFHFAWKLAHKSIFMKIQTWPFCRKISTHGVSRMLILTPTLAFWICNPKSVFGQIWAEKNQSCPFCLKIRTHGILKVLIPNPDLDFWNADSKIHYWENLG